MSEIVEMLRALLRCTLDEKAVVLANAAEARATLQLLLTSLPHPDAAASAHLGALGVAIDQAEIRKIAALEAEAVIVENALVDFEGVDGQHGVYSDVLRRTRAMSLSCVEPNTVQVISTAATSPLEQCLSAYVVAPRALSPDDLIVRTHGPWLRPGHSVGVLELSVAPSVIEGRPIEEVAAWGRFIAQHVSADVCLLSHLDESTERAVPLPVTVNCASSSMHSATCCVEVPDTVDAADIVVSGLWLAGSPVALPGGSEEPGASTGLRFSVRIGGLLPPLSFPALVSIGNWHSSCVTSDGILYVPQNGSHKLHAFSSSGITLPGIPLAPLGQSNVTRSVAHADAEKLLVLGEDKADGVLCAVDADPPHALRWTSAPGELQQCFGLTILPAQHVAVGGSYRDNKLVALSLTDGRFVCSAINAPGVSYVTADPASGSVFASLNEGGGYVVVKYEWRDSPGPPALCCVGPIAGLPTEGRHRPLAYVPASRSCPSAHLVVGLCNTAVLCVFELPSLRLVCEDSPLGPNAKVYGLAGDPCGTSLVIHDGAPRDGGLGTVQVVQWPLEAMVRAPTSI